MKKTTKELLDEALGKLGSIPEANRNAYANSILLRHYFQEECPVGHEPFPELEELLLNNFTEYSNPVLAPFSGTSHPFSILNNSKFQPLARKLIFEFFEASNIFKESFALVDPLVAAVRRLEALLEAEHSRD